MVTYSSVVVLGSTAWHGLGVGSFAWNSLAPLSVSGIPCGASNMVSGLTWLHRVGRSQDWVVRVGFGYPVVSLVHLLWRL